MDLANPQQNENKPLAQSPSQPHVKFANKIKLEVVNITDDSKTIVMGNSQAATQIAAKLDIIRLPRICHDNSLDELLTAVDACEDLVKVVFIDYSICVRETVSSNPGKVKESLELAWDIVNGRCEAQNHMDHP